MNNTCGTFELLCWLDYGVYKVLNGINWVWQKVLDGVLAVFNSVPVPQFLIDFNFSFTNEIAWAAELVAAQQGLIIFTGAYTIRFIIRRIPVVG